MSYVDEVYESVVAKNPSEPEFHQAVKEVLTCSGDRCQRRSIQKRSASGTYGRTGESSNVPCALGRRSGTGSGK